FKLTINSKGERVDFTDKPWQALVTEWQGSSGRTLYSGYSGGTFSIGLDKVINVSDGFIIVCHKNDKFRAVYTDMSLTVKKTVDLRQVESDKGEYMHEYTFCNGAGNSNP